MLDAGVLTFQEFVMHEPLLLATIHNAVFEFLQGRDDVVMFGAQAVNAYVREPRMTQDIDLVSLRADRFAHELRDYLSQRFHIAVRIREVGEGRGYRIYQVQKSGNRHLVDVRPVESLPAARRISQILVIAPAGLVASKVISYHQRRGHPKSGTDWRDLAMLLLTFPEFKRDPGIVTERLLAMGADAEVLATWGELVTQEILPAEDDGY